MTPPLLLLLLLLLLLQLLLLLLLLLPLLSDCVCHVHALARLHTRLLALLDISNDDVAISCVINRRHSQC